MKKHLLYILTISLFEFVAVVTYAAPITQNKELTNSVTIVRNPNEVLATVNGEKILRLELDRVLDKAKRHAKKTELHNIEERILNDLITQLVLKQFIKKENIQISSSLIEEEINAFRENINSGPKNSGKTLEMLLEEEGGSIDELRVAMDISLSLDKYLDRTVSAEDVEKYFNENITVFGGGSVRFEDIQDKVKLELFNEKTIVLIQELNDKSDVNILYKPTPYTPAPPVSSTFGQHKQVETNQKDMNETEVQINSLDIKQDFTFRKTKWGMSESDVKSSESLELFQKDDNLLAYKTNVLDKDVYAVYIFIDNQLVRARYILAESHSNMNDYIDDYLDFKAILEKKYGKPLDDQTIWKDETYKDDASRWGFAVSIGELVFYSTWITSSTEITNSLGGDNYEITCLVEYRSVNLKEIENKAAEKKALDNF